MRDRPPTRRLGSRRRSKKRVAVFRALVETAAAQTCLPRQCFEVAIRALPSDSIYESALSDERVIEGWED
ncbi:hypothetical protein [Methylobacterium goesingense]|uniref:Uncharacterized protein n=1 Tax=Methylobacterium goesingense TaxID=243690 RepID=A0ABV2L1D3_9HYPH|nr:hypothetical protein [Methylobacterium goesingense]